MFSSQLYKDEVIFNDETPAASFDAPEGMSCGLDLGLRGPGEFEYGEFANPFPKELLIPRSEWQARIQEMEEQKSRISDLIRLKKLPHKDQNGTNYCATEDTEVLTEKGWVQWPEYNGSDLLATMSPLTGAFELQAPIAVHAFEHDGPMVYCDQKRLDFAVTPDHRMLLRKWDESKRTLSKNFTFQRAGDIGWYAGVPHSTTSWLGSELIEVGIPDDRSYDGDDLIALLSLIVSGGYAGGSENTKNWVSFCCFRPEAYPAVAALAARTGFSESPSKKGVWIRYNAGALAEWVRKNCYTGSDYTAFFKRVPDLIKVSSMRQIGIFLSFFGDKSHTRPDNQTYFSSSKRLIDDLQELHLKIGKRGTITTRPEKVVHFAIPGRPEYDSICKMGWTLTIARVDRLCIDKKKHIHTENYRGNVYCATVPNSTLITRRNDSVLISGNCWINAPTHCVEINRLQQNQRTVSLSPASAGAQIKQYRNSGGWGLEGLQFVAKNGLVPSAKWPDNAIDKRYATSENKELALDYRVDEWMECRPRNVDEMISMLLRRYPGAGGYNWWSHEVTNCDPIWLDNTAAVRIRNSWKGWGDFGFGILQGSKMLADDLVFCLNARPT